MLIMLINILLPTVLFWGGLIAFSLSYYKHYTLTGIVTGLLIAIFILYFLIPIIITHYAIKKHWSVYLDRFFNQWLSPSLVLVILLLLPLTTGIKIPEISETLCGSLYFSYISIVPCYCLIYIVIFWHNLWRLVRKIVKFIYKKL